jgi:phosphatidylglycerophosphate synthase
MAQIGASRSVAVHMIGKLKTVGQMVAIPFLLFDGLLFGVLDTRLWGTVLIWIAAVLTVVSMVYYMQQGDSGDSGARERLSGLLVRLCGCLSIGKDA